jgi:bleomycin hydrolase
MEKNLTFRDVERFEKEFDSDPKNRLAENAVTRVGIQEAATDNDLQRTLTHTFSLEVNAGLITNQKQSGRCWMFAATNVFRLEVMKNLNLDNMELSQNYPLFWDKLEKSNYFLENILKTLKEPTEGRLLAFLLQSPLGDGGQWDMFADLVRKYGVCPKSAMPETAASSKTNEMDKYLTKKLREYACKLRKEAKKGKSVAALRKEKDGMLATIYRMLVISLGKPPRTFTYDAKSKDNKLIHIENITPVDFFRQYVKVNLDDYVSIINAPTADKPFLRSFTVKFLGNVEGGKAVRYLNLPSSELKRLAIAQMKDGKAVWFGSDVGQFSTRDSGFLSLDSYDLKGLFGTDFRMSKAERLDYGESLMTHAMVLTGVNLENGRPNRWRVENSWGDTYGNKGFWVMDDRWFDEFTYQIVIDKKYLSAKELAAYEEKPIELEPWDPMGSLAL